MHDLTALAAAQLLNMLPGLTGCDLSVGAQAKDGHPYTHVKANLKVADGTTIGFEVSIPESLAWRESLGVADSPDLARIIAQRVRFAWICQEHLKVRDARLEQLGMTVETVRARLPTAATLRDQLLAHLRTVAEIREVRPDAIEVTLLHSRRDVGILLSELAWQDFVVASELEAYIDDDFDAPTLGRASERSLGELDELLARLPASHGYIVDDAGTLRGSPLTWAG